MARNIYGLDLGTYQLKIYDKNKDDIRTEKNAIAVENENTIFAVGDTAYEMYEKAPQNIEIVFPMKEGVISRFSDMQYVLSSLLKNENGIFSRGTEYLIAVPTDVTEVEKKAFYDLVMYSAAKAREVNIVARAVADAVGFGIDVRQADAVAIVNIGGETTDISVLSGGGIVLNRLLKVGGATFDHAIVNLVRHTQDFAIGRLTAEMIRKQMDVFMDKSDKSIAVAGRDLAFGRPKIEEVSIRTVRAAMKEALDVCADSILALLERTPPEILSSIRRTGIYLTGGVARTNGITEYLEGKVGLAFHTVKSPELCVVKGLKEMILSSELRELAYSMKDENYRWMR